MGCGASNPSAQDPANKYSPAQLDAGEAKHRKHHTQHEEHKKEEVRAQRKSKEQVQKELQKQKEEYARFEAARKEKRIATNRKSFVFEMLDVDADGFINRKEGV